MEKEEFKKAARLLSALTTGVKPNEDKLDKLYQDHRRDISELGRDMRDHDMNVALEQMNERELIAHYEKVDTLLAKKYGRRMHL